MHRIGFYCSSGFVARSIIDSGLLVKLKRSGSFEITVFQIDNVCHDDGEVRYVCLAEPILVEWRSRGTIKRYFEYIRSFVTPPIPGLNTIVDFRRNEYLRLKRQGRWLYAFVMLALSWTLSHFKLARNILRGIEGKILGRAPKLRTYLRNSFDSVVVTAMSGFASDEWVCNAARSAGVKTIAQIFSWDNISGLGDRGCDPDHVFVWSSYMKNELVDIHSTSHSKIKIVGVPQFFDHWRRRSRYAPDRCAPIKILFLTKSPRRFSYNVALSKMVYEALASLVVDFTFTIRIHPLTFRHKDGVFIFEDEINQFDFFRNSKSNVGLSVPKIGADSFRFLDSKADADEYLNLIESSDLIFNMFSTAMIESAIIGRPIVNLCFSNDSFGDSTATGAEVVSLKQDLNSDARQDHIRSILNTGAIRTLFSEDELRPFLLDFIDIDYRLKMVRNLNQICTLHTDNIYDPVETCVRAYHETLL